MLDPILSTGSIIRSNNVKYDKITGSFCPNGIKSVKWLDQNEIIFAPIIAIGAQLNDCSNNTNRGTGSYDPMITVLICPLDRFAPMVSNLFTDGIKVKLSLLQ